MHRTFETLLVDCVREHALQLNKPFDQGQHLLIPLLDKFFLFYLCYLWDLERQEDKGLKFLIHHCLDMRAIKSSQDLALSRSLSIVN